MKPCYQMFYHLYIYNLKILFCKFVQDPLIEIANRKEKDPHNDLFSFVYKIEGQNATLYETPHQNLKSSNSPPINGHFDVHKDCEKLYFFVFNA